MYDAKLMYNKMYRCFRGAARRGFSPGTRKTGSVAKNTPTHQDEDRKPDPPTQKSVATPLLSQIASRLDTEVKVIAHESSKQEKSENYLAFNIL